MRLAVVGIGLVWALASAASAAPPPEPDDGYYDRGAVGADAGTPRISTETAEPVEPPANQAVAGYASVFYVRPQRNGADVPGVSREAADRFCHDHGFGATLSFDDNGRTLRDVLCRRER